MNQKVGPTVDVDFTGDFNLVFQPPVPASSVDQRETSYWRL